MKRSVAKIVSISNIVEPKQKVSACEDVDDNMILECAKEGNSEYLVTSDRHSLNLKEFEGVKIVTPEDFLKFLKTITSRT